MPHSRTAFLATSFALLFIFAWGCRGRLLEETEEIGLVTYTGMCDASAAVALDDATLLVADDEKNVFGVYRADPPGPPLETIRWDEPLAIDPDNDEHPEADVEGAAVLGDCIFWITSHGRNRDGKWRPNRHRFFAMRPVRGANGLTFEPFGKPYRELALRLADDPRLRELGFDDALGPEGKKAKKLAPKSAGLNIEGLAAMPDGRSLLIGFRNPRPGGKAVVTPLLNPTAVLAEGAAPEFGDPILLDLQAEFAGKSRKLGIRSLAFLDSLKCYLIVAGPHGEKKHFAIFRWSGKPEDQPKLLPRLTASVHRAGDFAPEALIVYPGGDKIQLLGDDGSRMVEVESAAECREGTFQDGQCEAKYLLDPERQTFRSFVFSMDELR
ncbi:MAG TPA: DUF3616 domain-containing protein [Planctomycetaceae bacterium]|nr:DUF3616 domain-containing protein [Planctomycetaceae bacterium]